MTVFFIADLHFGDEALAVRRNGGPRRPFQDAQEMNREMARRWNERVDDDDTVYVLGDLGRAPHWRLVANLRGKKELVGGNGDDLRAIASAGVFSRISAVRYLSGLLLSHIPVHPSQLRGSTVNVHGHIHERSLGDRRYICVSMEQTYYCPITLDEVVARATLGSPTASNLPLLL